MATIISCFVLPSKPGAMPLTTRNSSLHEKLLPRCAHLTKTLAFSNSLSSISLPIDYSFGVSGGASIRALENPKPLRRSVVCNAMPTKKADSAEKRARQAEKRRMYNKAKKSEVKTRMKKIWRKLKPGEGPKPKEIFEALGLKRSSPTRGILHWK
ncbi:hypothetical protein KSP40_PGU020034 [Platanthera guangdongensis]|uniref:Uncharacterized protein n=1 Tax=Platanthera guangdongensis TaxID=2320717 RepID=A0ABR2M7Z2_9ASPA